MSRYVVTWGTRAILVDATDTDAAKRRTIERLAAANASAVEHGRPKVVVPPPDDLNVRAATKEDEALFPHRRVDQGDQPALYEVRTI